MSMPTEITIKIKSEDTTISEKFLSYEEFTISQDDSHLNTLVKKVLSQFNGDVSNLDVNIKIKISW